MNKIIEATAPVRVDLAGGTLDLYPLYLFLGGATTVNLAISLTTQVLLEPRTDNKIRITALDSDQSVSAKNAAALPTDGPLGFVCRAVRFFHHDGGLNITTNTVIPRGSGLGTSSSLLVALSSALCKYNNIRLSPDALVDRIAELEAQAIGVPTGKQDYYAAIHGGVNAVHFDIAEKRVEPLVDQAEFLQSLEEHCLLTFTGESHQSAIANWNMLKAYVENSGDNRTRMNTIKKIALQMRQALLDHDLRAVARLLGKEWEQRKGLAKGVATPQTDALIAAAQGAGAYASKICGAGGGGCMITIVPPKRRAAVSAALERAGAKVLPFGIHRQGVRVKLLG